jgi:hypothetical protein
LCNSQGQCECLAGYSGFPADPNVGCDPIPCNPACGANAFCDGGVCKCNPVCET